MSKPVSIELIKAVYKKDVASVRKLLKAGVNPTIRDTLGRLALHAACEIGELEIVKLLSEKTDINALSYGKPALSFAASNGHPEIVKYLLCSGAKPDLRSENHPQSNREFHEAGTTPLLEMFLKKGLSGTTKKWSNNEIACARALLEAGANPLMSNVNNTTPLALAKDELYEILKEFKNNASVDLVVSSDDATALNHGWIQFFSSRLRATGLNVIDFSDKQFAASDNSDTNLEKLSFITNSAHKFIEFSKEKLASDSNKLMIDRNSIEHITDFAPVSKIWRQIYSFFALSEQYSDVLFGLRILEKGNDLFISYKSHDAEIARNIAESLQCYGIKVWIAEYSILLTGRGEFQEMINRGIATSKKAICLSNARYADSPYCQIEALILLELLGNSNVVEIQIPAEDHKLSTLFRNRTISQVVWNTDSEVTSWSKVCSYLGIGDVPLNRTITSTNVHNNLKTITIPYRNIKVTMDCGAWEIEPGSLTARENDVTTVAVMRFRKDDDVYIEGRLTALDPDWCYNYDLGITENRNALLDDDRDRYEMILRYFKKFIRPGGNTWFDDFICKGVHLIHIENVAYPGITYFVDNTGNRDLYYSDIVAHDMNYRDWDLLRHYPIILKHPMSPKKIEFRFNFKFLNEDMNRCYETLLKYAHLADSLVRSIKIVQGKVENRPKPNDAIEEHFVERIVGRSLALLVLVYRAYAEISIQNGELEKNVYQGYDDEVNTWASKEGLEQYFSRRERILLCDKLGSWLKGDTGYELRQSRVHTMLWYLGLANRPVVTINPDKTIYETALFLKPGARQTLIQNALKATYPSLSDQRSFAITCLLYATRFRISFSGRRTGILSDPKRAAIEMLEGHGWSGLFDVNSIRFADDGDFYIPLGGCSITQLPLEEWTALDAWAICENQLLACDRLGIPSPGIEFRSQFNGSNLSRLLPDYYSSHSDIWGKDWKNIYTPAERSEEYPALIAQKIKMSQDLEDLKGHEKICRHQNLLPNLSICLDKQSVIYNSMGKPDEARKCLEESIDITIKLFEEALDIAVKNNSPKYIVLNHFCLAHHYLLKQLLPQAKNHIQEGKIAAEHFGLFPEKVVPHVMMSRISSLMARYGIEIDLSCEYNKINKSFENEIMSTLNKLGGKVTLSKLINSSEELKYIPYQIIKEIINDLKEEGKITTYFSLLKFGEIVTSSEFRGRHT